MSIADLLDFFIIFIIALNATVTIVLASKLTHIVQNEFLYRVVIFSLYLTTTFTIVFVSDQLIGWILLSFLPMLALYARSNDKTLWYAIICHPFIVLTYYFTFYHHGMLEFSLRVLVGSYILFFCLFYLFIRIQSAKLKAICCAGFVSIFETTSQIIEYHGLVFSTVILFMWNIVTYLIIFMLIRRLAVLLLKAEETDYQEKYIDDLTNAYNFKAFSQHYNGTPKDEDYLLAIIDVDGFKQINDQHGHDVGNLILSKLSEILADNLQGKHQFFDYKVYRYGGEELIVAVKCNFDTKIEDQAQGLLKTLLQVNEQFGNTTQKLINEHVTFSGGLTAYSLWEYSDDKTFKQADTLLYEAKSDSSIIIKTDL